MSDGSPANGDNLNKYKGIFRVIRFITKTRLAKWSVAARSMWSNESSNDFPLCRKSLELSLHIFTNNFITK